MKKKFGWLMVCVIVFSFTHLANAQTSGGYQTSTLPIVTTNTTNSTTTHLNQTCKLFVSSGLNQKITLPHNTVTLNGTKSSCVDKYVWSVTSGTSGYVFTYPNSVSTQLTNLVQGVYYVRLTGYDLKGKSKSSLLKITVNKNPNPLITINTSSTTNTNTTNATTNISSTNLNTSTNNSTICSSSFNTGSCSYYASPTGGGNGLSVNSPFKVSNFWSVASSGKTLCLLDGKYTGADSMITPPSNLSGTATAPITITTLSDGGAEFDGQGQRQPVYLEDNDYFVLKGFNAHNAGINRSVITFKNSDYNRVERVVGKADDGDNNVFRSWGGKFNTFVDTGGIGGRKTYSSSQGGDGMKMVRAWGFSPGPSTYSGPPGTFKLSYNSYDNKCYNCISSETYQDQPKNYQLLSGTGTGGAPTGIFYDNYEKHQADNWGFGHDGFDILPEVANITIKGSIAYINKEANKIFSQRTWPGPMSFEVKGVNIQNSISLVEPSSSRSYQPRSIYLQGGQYGLNSATNITAIGGTGASIGSSWLTSNNYINNNCATLVANGGNVLNPSLNGISGGATIMKRYDEDGNLTNQDLWPWPMEKRIREAMIAWGYNPISVTEDVFSLCGGTVPPAIQTALDAQMESNNTMCTTTTATSSTTPISSTNLEDIVTKAKQWLVGNASTRASLQADLLAWNNPAQIDQAIALIKPNNYTVTQTGKILNQSFATPEFNTKYSGHKFHLYVPSHYRPGTPIGLMLWLHGGGTCGTGQSFTQDMLSELEHLDKYDFDDEIFTGRSQPRTETDTSNYILVAPVAPCGSIIPHPGHASRWNVPVADQYLLDIMTEVDKKYNIDENKIVLTGFSMGGIGAYHQVHRLSDRFSAVMASAGSWNLGSWGDLINTPIYFMQGVNDAYWSSSSCRAHFTPIEAARAARDLAVLGNTQTVLHESPGGHPWDNKSEQDWKNFINGQTGWVTNKVRNPYATRVIGLNPWRTYEKGDNFNVIWYEDPSPDTLWLSIKGVGSGTILYDWAKTSGDGGCNSQSSWNNWSLVKDKKALNGARAEAKIIGLNQVSITTQNVTDLSIWLHPKMGIDTTKPITVTLDGVTTQKNCNPSLLDALRSYERRQDWQMSYLCEIDVK